MRGTLEWEGRDFSLALFMLNAPTCHSFMPRLIFVKQRLLNGIKEKKELLLLMTKDTVSLRKQN